MKLRLLMVALLVMLLVATPASAASITPHYGASASVVMVQTPMYQIVSANSGKCLDVTMASMADGARVQQWTCLGAQYTNQLWYLVWVGQGYQIVSVNSGKCLDVDMFSMADGGVVQQWTCLGAEHTNQVWEGRWNSHLDLSQLVAVHSGKCLDVNMFSMADGGVVQQWSCLGWEHTNQLWYVRQVS